jgi:hypothetical protein
MAAMDCVKTNLVSDLSDLQLPGEDSLKRGNAAAEAKPDSAWATRKPATVSGAAGSAQTPRDAHPPLKIEANTLSCQRGKTIEFVRDGAKGRMSPSSTSGLAAESHAGKL